MGQYDIAEFLAKNPKKWFMASEIANELKLKSVDTCLRKLRGSKLIDYRFDPKRFKHGCFEYRHKNGKTTSR